MLMLADELFFVAHDEHSGKARLHRRATGLGLAAALLSELALSGNITVANGTVTVTEQHPPEDDLAYRVLHQLSVQRQHQALRTWLAFLGQGAIDRVGMRMARAGYVRPHKGRAPWSKTVRYVPTDLKTASWPAARLNLRVNRGDPLTVSDSILAGLVAATGLTKHVWWDGDAVTLRHLAAAVASLPMSLRELVAHTEAAVGDVVLTPHN